jgi:hypothetical protein
MPVVHVPAAFTRQVRNLDDLTGVRVLQMQHRALQQVRQFDNLLRQCKQRPTNRFIQDAPIQLLEGAQAA